MNYVLGFLFDDAQRVVQLVRKNKGPVDMAGKLNGIGGKIEPGEHHFEAMVREFREETGAETAQADWRHFSTMEFQYTGAKVYCFAATSSAALEHVRQIEDEMLVLASVPLIIDNNCHAVGFEIMGNLPWLIAMALFDVDACPAEVAFA